jgi:hypothetical protein
MGKPERKRQLEDLGINGRSKMDVKEIGWE